MKTLKGKPYRSSLCQSGALARHLSKGRQPGMSNFFEHLLCFPKAGLSHLPSQGQLLCPCHKLVIDASLRNSLNNLLTIIIKIIDASLHKALVSSSMETRFMQDHKHHDDHYRQHDFDDNFKYSDHFQDLDKCSRSCATALPSILKDRVMADFHLNVMLYMEDISYI